MSEVNENEFYENYDIPFEEEEYSLKTIRETQINIPSLAEAKAEMEEWQMKFQKLFSEFYNFSVIQVGKLPLDILQMIHELRDQFWDMKNENYLLKQMLNELAPKFFDSKTQREYALFLEADQLYLRKRIKDKKYKLFDALQDSIKIYSDDKYFNMLLKFSQVKEIYQDYLRWRSKNKKDRANFSR
jgi:hypothetical protein